MRRLTLLFIVISTAVAGYGQGVGGIVLPPIAVPPVSVNFDNTNSVIDQNGNTLIFDSVFTGILPVSSASSTPVPTHVTVISSDGKTVNGYSYPGSFQIVGVGHNAVYAIVGSVSATASQFVVRRTLVALRVVAGTLPGTLPSIVVPMNDDVKLSAGTGAGDSDTIALISGASLVFLPSPVTTGPANNPHTVLLYTCDGATFTPNLNNPITAPSH